MKKTISILLALVMVLALSIAAFADDDISIASGNKSQEVTAQYVSGTVSDPGTVYHVTIEWTPGENTLVYTDSAAAFRWDPDTLTYVPADEGGTAPGWSGSAQYTVTVTNKSNAAVTAEAKWQDDEGITANCSYADGNTVALGSAAEGVTPDNGETGKEQTGSITAEITVEEGSITSATTIGTLTVTLSAD